jgi:2-dehydropantoate 2-reductase
MRIAVFGAGGAGGYFGGRLAHGGEQVVLIARGEHLRAIRDHGLAVESDEGSFVARPELATDDPEAAGPVDVVVLGVKAWQVESAAAAARPLLGNDGFLVTLQNGVEAAGGAARVLGEGRVVPGLCGTMSYVEAPGRIRSMGKVNFVRFGESDRRPSERTERLRDAFARAGVSGSIPDDIHVALWEKLLFVASFGAVGALARAPIGVLRSVPETRSLLRDAMAEIFAVGRANGIALRDDAVAKAEAFLDALAPEGTTSLQRDLAEGRPSELEAWSGAVVRLGRATGVPTPVHDIVYRSQIPAERRARAASAL